MSTIYAMSDPREIGSIRYVGQTRRSLSRRYSDHLTKATKNRFYSCNWIRSLLADGVKPVCVPIEFCDDSESDVREVYWISRLKSEGHRLTNNTNGGDGCKGFKMPQEIVDRVSRRKHKPESILKMRIAKLGKSLTPEHRAKVVFNLEKSRGRKHTPQSKMRLSAAHTGKTLSAEHREKISKSILARSSDVQKKAASAWSKARWSSKEARATQAMKVREAWMRKQIGLVDLGMAKKGD